MVQQLTHVAAMNSNY